MPGLKNWLEKLRARISLPFAADSSAENAGPAIYDPCRFSNRVQLPDAVVLQDRDGLLNRDQLPDRVQLLPREIKKSVG